MRGTKLISILSILFFISCSKSKFPVEPSIRFVSKSDNDIKAGTDKQLIFAFSFTDGDGDLGYSDDDSINNIIFIDQRDSSILKFKFPEIKSDYNPENGVKGQFAVSLNAAFVTKRTDTAHLLLDTVRWSVYLFDKAGHQSNTVETSDLILTQ